MGFTVPGAWIDEAIIWGGLPWVFKAPMTPKEFKYFWNGMVEESKLNYVLSSLSGDTGDVGWFWFTTLNRKPEKRSMRNHRIIMNLIDRRTRP